MSAEPPPPAQRRDAAAGRLRTIDLVALGALTLAAVLGFAALALINAESLLFEPAEILSMIAGLIGLGVGVGALVGSKGRPKWPGILALLSPVIPVYVLYVIFVAIAGVFVPGD